MVGSNYFTKWDKAIHYQPINRETTIKFIKKQIIYKHGLLKTTNDQGSIFTKNDVK